jgi:hypothetical protein
VEGAPSQPSPNICEFACLCSEYNFHRPLQAYKHVFTSPSSVEKETKATRSGNARIHGMTNVTPESVAYIATQVSVLVDLFLWALMPSVHRHRSALLSAHQLSFLIQTLQPTLNDFTIACWTF